MAIPSEPVPRRTLLKAAAALSGLSTLGVQACAPAAAVPALQPLTMADAPLASGSKVTVERRGQIVLIGLNRPEIHNRLDPEAFTLLAEAYYQYDHDPSLRAAVLFGHGPNFSRGIDVNAFRARVTKGGGSLLDKPGTLDPLAKSKIRRTKPLVAVVHGDTWNMGHEIHLAADIRIAAANTRYGQDENTHGRFPGGGSTVRFVREAGWGNAMRYILTGDHWSAEEALRIGVVQSVCPTPEAALQVGIEMATKIAACGPLGIRASLDSAHLAIDESEQKALSQLDAQYGALYKTQDFVEGRNAEAEGRPPVYLGR
ncbi:enoyl-CoA hydratase-related protein [Pendulispora brunnea]|uniref:Enoyl-CoA hydratase-related protein n=1 Tax=Pendulispora brunnea TaxID=2905690 RepID=A0ABZ2K4U4_9BACT